MQDKNNWVMVSFPHDFDHHIADQLIHEAVMESGLSEVGIESIGEFEDDNPVFYLEFKTRGPGRDWVMNTLSKHAYVQGVTGVSSIPPVPVRGDSTVPPPPAGPESVPPMLVEPPMPLHALLPPKMEEDDVDTLPPPWEVELDLPQEEEGSVSMVVNPSPPSLPLVKKTSLGYRLLATLGLFVSVEAVSVGLLFLLKTSGANLPSESVFVTGVLSTIISGVFFYYITSNRGSNPQ